MNYDVVVIGVGLAGLTAGLRLAQAGRRGGVTIAIMIAIAVVAAVALAAGATVVDNASGSSTTLALKGKKHDRSSLECACRRRRAFTRHRQ